MTEAEWLADTQWGQMLNQVRDGAGTRKLLLLAVALCRRIWGRFPYDDCRRAVVEVERLADHPRVDDEDYTIAAAADAAAEQLQQGYGRVDQVAPGPRGAYLAAVGCGGMWHDPGGLIEGVAGAAAVAAAGDAGGPAWEAERRAQAKVLRDIFDNPFRPVSVSPAWQTAEVVALAEAAYDGRELPAGTLDLARLAVLADALEEAGCDQADLLGHLRGPGPHVRGCWAVDLILGKS